MDCIRRRLNNRWDGLAISLKYGKCPSCNQWMKAEGHQWLQTKVEEAIDLDKKIREKCVLRAKHEGMDYDERIKDKKSEYFNNLEQFAMDHLNYYECYECKEPYFGGHRQCGNPPPPPQVEAENQEEDAKMNEEDKKEEEEEKEALKNKPEQLICSKCVANVMKASDVG